MTLHIRVKIQLPLSCPSWRLQNEPSKYFHADKKQCLLDASHAAGEFHIPIVGHKRSWLRATNRCQRETDCVVLHAKFVHFTLAVEYPYLIALLCRGEIASRFSGADLENYSLALAWQPAARRCTWLGRIMNIIWKSQLHCLNLKPIGWKAFVAASLLHAFGENFKVAHANINYFELCRSAQSMKKKTFK